MRDVSVCGWWRSHDDVVGCFDPSGLSLHFQVGGARRQAENGMVAVELFASEFHALTRWTVGAWAMMTGRGRLRHVCLR